MEPKGRSRRETFKSVIVTPDVPNLGPKPRPGRLPSAELNQKLERFIAETTLPIQLHPVVRCAALLWHDYLDESHAISQQLDSSDGGFLHGIMHRREPDYANAKYWFHRVGKHPSYPNIADGVARLLENHSDRSLLATLAPSGRWDPIGFVNACETAAQHSPTEITAQTLRSIQEIEFNALLAHIFRGS